MSRAVKAMSKEEFDELCKEYFGHEIELSNNVSTVDMNQLLQITQNTAMSVNAQSKQMGLILGTVEELKQDVGSIKQEMEVLKRETTITRPMCRRIRKAVMSQVNKVLKIKFDGGKVADEARVVAFGVA